MKSRKSKILIETNKPPKVLFVGNGVLLLNKGTCWSELFRRLNPDEASIPGICNIPFAMRPEAVRGTDVEEVQRLTAASISSDMPHDILKRLVFMNFDAILTTNYTYEIEDALTEGKWNESRRKNCHTTLYGSPHVRYNTYKCNLVKDIKGREVPVFHVHGEKNRKHSLVLSYYSYADAVYHLIEMNKRRKNEYEEHQITGTPVACQGWLDYFLLGEVYAIGFGFDLSEFDIWWAVERKSREHARNGKLRAYMFSSEKKLEISSMFRAMNVEERFIQVTDEKYEDAYRIMLKELSAE